MVIGRYLIIFMLVLFTSCAWTLNTRDLDNDIRDTLHLYPKDCKYKIVILPDMETLNKKHLEISKEDKNVLGFYHFSTNTVYIYNGCRIDIVRHEIAHALLDCACKGLSTEIHHIIIRATAYMRK